MSRARASRYARTALVRAGNLWATRGRRSVSIGPGGWLHPTAEVRTSGDSTVTLGRGVRVDAHTILNADGGTLRLGAEVWVEAHGYISAEDGFVTLGDRVYVGPGTAMYGKGGLTIGEDCIIGPQVVLSAQAPRHDDPGVPIAAQGYRHAGITIGRDVGVGAHATILDGVTIGDRAVVAAGAVVTRSVPPLAIVAGFPAGVVGERGGTASVPPAPAARADASEGTDRGG